MKKAENKWVNAKKFLHPDKSYKGIKLSLFQMIPKAIAERLKRGETYMETCEVFPSVTMLFSGKCVFSSVRMIY